MKEFVK